jgi:hypothetical protein
LVPFLPHNYNSYFAKTRYQQCLFLYREASYKNFRRLLTELFWACHTSKRRFCWKFKPKGKTFYVVILSATYQCHFVSCICCFSKWLPAFLCTVLLFSRQNLLPFVCPQDWSAQEQQQPWFVAEFVFCLQFPLVSHLLNAGVHKSRAPGCLGDQIHTVVPNIIGFSVSNLSMSSFWCL